MECMKRRGECVSDDVGTLASLKVRLKRGKKLRNNPFRKKKKAHEATLIRAIHGTTNFRREDAPLERNVSTTQPTIDYQTQNSPFSRYFSTAER